MKTGKYFNANNYDSLLKKALANAQVSSLYLEYNEILIKGISYRQGDALIVSHEDYQYNIKVGKIMVLLYNETEDKSVAVVEVFETSCDLARRVHRLGQMLRYEFIDVTENGFSQSIQNPVSTSQNYLNEVLKKVPDGIIRACEQGNRLTSTQLTNLASQIRIFMLDCLQDSTLGTARIIAAQLCQKFTKTFTTEISEGNTISLECYFRQKIYSTVNYHKGKDLKAKRCILQAFDSVDEDISRPSKVQKKGQYGCAAGQYTPSLPSNDDDLQLLKIKCSNLIKFYKDGVNVKDDRIMTLMKDTYALQRHDIVYSYPCLDDRFFEKWPYLKNYEILFTHASQLIGVENIQEKWKEVLARHNKPIIEFLEAEERIHVLQSRKKQKISSDNLFIRNTIHKANSHAINVSQSNIPLIAVIFPIIIHFFNEEEKLLYMVVDVSC
ncbi:hypothetical protein HCN44_010034 [Aphidius gifuensis]|uniref:Uncharacterized protein n=1 Tax=Aphidius gifuensis TaxID=684658 RepID=A0A835CS14_APHGI|nr:hypothetical protein HCN44_010034 [Aphidius gifuensis]